MLTFSNTPARSGLRPTRVRMRIPCESARARPKFDFETLDDMKRTQAEFQERQKGSVTANGLAISCAIDDEMPTCTKTSRY